MRRRIFIILAILAIAIVTIYITFKDSLPPRTPQKVSRLISGLSIPRDAKVVEFKDQWNDFNGNGFAFIVLSLEEESFNKIYQEAKSLHFKTLPIKENIFGPLNDFSEKKTNGIYKIQIDNEASMSFSGTVLSTDDNSVIVYVAVN
jgi:hypothetical protein